MNTGASIATDKISCILCISADNVIRRPKANSDTVNPIAQGSSARDIGPNEVAQHLVAVRARVKDKDATAGITTDEVSSPLCLSADNVIRRPRFDGNTVSTITQGSNACDIGPN